MSNLSEKVKACDKKADVAIAAMVATVIGTAAIPAHVNWALTASVIGSGVIAIAGCYEQNLDKDGAWELIKKFFLAAGTWFIAMNIGARFFAMLFSTTKRKKRDRSGDRSDKRGYCEGQSRGCGKVRNSSDSAD